MKTKRFIPSFFDTEGMLPGDIVTFDPSKEGTGGREEGIIAVVYHFSIVTESGKPVAVARILTHCHPSAETTQPRQPLAAEDKKTEKKYTSFPF